MRLYPDGESGTGILREYGSALPTPGLSSTVILAESDVVSFSIQSFCNCDRGSLFCGSEIFLPAGGVIS